MNYPKYVEPEQLHRESEAVLMKKVNALLLAMTPEETMNLCHGHENPDGAQAANAGYLPGIPRLGVPEIRMFDGPAGVTSVYETTGLPVQEALAASWDPDLAYQYGKVAGSENFAISGNTQLGSQFDIVRTPHFVRNRDMLGEDPFLTARLAAEETKGIQDQHVVATLKHFAAASIGTDMQDTADQIIDEQTLHELYFPSFEAAAKEGGAFMCSYNKFNGAYASANEYAQKAVLRDMWNYKGYIMSDWGANHALTIGKGMDMEMPNGAYNSNERILRGIEKGRITWDDVISAARHVLYGFGLAGYLSLVQLDENGHVLAEEGRIEPIRMKDRYTESVKAGLLRENSKICLEIAREGIVLMKNENRTLPLMKSDYTGENSVAMLGLGAVSLLSGSGGERSYGRISRMKAPAVEVRRLAGPDANIDSEIAADIFGETIPAEYLYQDGTLTQHGVIRTWGVADDGTPVSAFPGPAGDDTPTAVGGAGQEFHGVASAEDEEEDIPFLPPWTNSQAADVPGHETGSFCCTDGQIDFTCGTLDGGINQSYKNSGDGCAFPMGEAYTWRGCLTVPESGEYTLILQAIGGNTTLKIKLDGEHFTNIGSTSLREGAQWPWGSLVCTPEGMEIHGANCKLEAGKAYPFELQGNASIRHKDLQIRLSWISPKMREQAYQAALAAAAKAKKVLVFVSEDYSFPAAGTPMAFSMSSLSSMEIPAQQQKLIRDVKAAMQPDAKLILVHNSGLLYAYGSVEPMADAILNVWNPGQEGGQAIAEVLLGIYNPSGKSAITVPARDEDTLVTDTCEHRKTRYEGYPKGGKMIVEFDEGIFTGYRWYEKTGVKPLYPFGHGLSYTAFSYGNLEADVMKDGVVVRFTVTNTGDLPGTETAQVYLGEGAVPAGIQMAKKQLCGFAKADLRPWETKWLTVEIPVRALCYWDPNRELAVRPDGTKDKWVKAAGFRTVYVGASAEDLRLEAALEIL